MINTTPNFKSPFKLLPALIMSTGLIISNGVLADNSTKIIGPNIIQSQQHQSGFPPVFQIPFNAHCASGFNKAGEQKVNKDTGKWTDAFVCTTQIITCPKQTQPNGKISTVQPLVVIQKTTVNPDGGQVKFRIQYKCDYNYTVIPEG